MLEILQSCWDLVLGLGASVWGVVVLVAAGSWDVLGLLHETAPRLEGLVIGVALAWVMLRRDKHPLLRVVSAPLKLIVDILDLAWDQVVEIVSDVWGTAKRWVLGVLGWCKSVVVGSYNRVMGVLQSVLDKLSSKKAE